MTQTALIQSVLHLYGVMGIKSPVNLKAWTFYRAQATERKAWAETVDQTWIDRACEVSIEMYQDTLCKPAIVLAAEFYSYGYYRANAKQRYYWIDPQARDLWATFEGSK
jgi:hypothetical protein